MAKKTNLEWRNCSEKELVSHLVTWLADAKWMADPEGAVGGAFPGAIFFLEGEMGAGKSTFARALISVLAPDQVSKGSPTFPLVHSYRARDGFQIYHIDLYRLKNGEELHESGIEEQMDEPGALVLVEWASKFPELFEGGVWSARLGRGVFRVRIEISSGVSESGEALRDVFIAG